MTRLSSNVKFIRKQLRLTQDQFGQLLGIKRSLVGAYEEGRAEPRLELLQQMATHSGFSVDTIIGTDLDDSTPLSVLPQNHQRGKEVLVVSVDSDEKENIELVPQKAAAGYLNGYADPEYVKELPKFKLPMLKSGTYRAFEISGDSMLPILPGTIIIGEYLDNLKDLKNGKTYVLVTEREGVVYKRVFNYLDESGKLFLVSDNRQYAPYQIDGSDVIEAWSAKAYISVQFPDVESQKDMSIEQLAGVVLDLQKEILDIKSKKK
ncbi:MAG: helix-turn-helix domain-containing protein [Cyclobacteriaceae bacterium]|nr:helix-turn-helix domain-containing protein [Cyclobacteriaceae bacterium]